jgi:PAS domain S-box-containing protein
MSGRLWSLADVRALVDALDVPMSATRDGRLAVVNAPFAAALGLPRDALEGRPWVDLVPPEERNRMQAHAARAPAEGDGAMAQTFPILLVGAGGKRVHLLVRTTWLRAVGDGWYALGTCLELAEAQHAQALSEVLNRAAAAAVAERSESGARARLVEALGEAGFTAAFLAEPGSGPGSASASEPGVQEVLATGRPVFVGPEACLPRAVLLPLGTGQGSPVLRLEGPGLCSQQLPALELFARLCASALPRARLFAELEQKDAASRRALEETRLLLELARTTAGTLELGSILDAAGDFLVRLLDLSNCFILLYDPATQVLRGAAASRKHRAFFRTVEIPLQSPGVAATAARERRPVVEEDTATGRLGRRDLIERFGEKALLSVPLLLRGELLGAVVLDDTRRPRSFSPELVRLAETSAGLLALSVANARLYESLRASYAVLEATRAEMVKRERLAALGELSAIVAHEVRNPLGVIFNAVSSLRRLVPQQGDPELLLDIVAEESDRLNRIVSDLLDFARPRALSLQLEDLDRLLRESLDAALADPALSGRVQIDAQLPSSLPPLPMDRHLLRQALVNVLVNAMQAMPQGGTVRLRVHAERDTQPAFVRIEVADEGSGIPPELLPRVFEPFFTTKARGTGLGLAVVKRIVEDHQGEVRVRSEPGGGTTFTFRLPLVARRASGS